MIATADTPVLDVSELPKHAIGERATLWWGVVIMMLIEGTMFAILLASYFYIRNEFRAWPPLGTQAPDLLPGIVFMVVLVVSAVPQWWADVLSFRTAEDNEAAMRWALVACSVTAVAAVVARCFEYPAMHTKWDTHAYGSVVWTLLGMHTVHLLASTLETIVLTVYSFARPMDAKHRLDLNVNALYWYFVVGTWVPSFAILYFTPRIG